MPSWISLNCSLQGEIINDSALMKSIMKIFSGEKWTFLPRISFSFSANRDDVEKNSLRLSSTKEKWIEFHARLDFYFFPLVFFRDFSEIKYHCVGGIFQYWRMEIYVKPLSCSISLERILMSNFGFQTEWKKLVKQIYNDFQICKSVGQGQAKHWDKQYCAINQKTFNERCVKIFESIQLKCLPRIS